MVFVKVSETYDLSTKIGKMGVVGIHTPRGSLVDRLYPGLILQHNKFRFVSCDVTMACASMLPADPLQIGNEAGSIAPQDMFNPILYRAVSNDSMSSLQTWLASKYGSSASSLHEGSVIDVNDANFQTWGGTSDVSVDQFNMYYGLLSNDDGWRKAMPQAGLQMFGLFPLVYQVVNQFGDVSRDNANIGMNAITSYQSNDSSPAPTNVVGVSFRGPSMKMPSITTTVFVGSDGNDLNIVPNNLAHLASNVGKVPPAYVAMIILPPAKMNQLYYRLKVTWTIEFTGLRAMTDVNLWSKLAEVGDLSYGTDYADQSRIMSSYTDMVDVKDADVDKIMEGS